MKFFNKKVLKEDLNKAYEENPELASAFDELYGMLKQHLPEDEYKGIVAKSLLRDKIKDKQ